MMNTEELDFITLIGKIKWTLNSYSIIGVWGITSIRNGFCRNNKLCCVLNASGLVLLAVGAFFLTCCFYDNQKAYTTVVKRMNPDTEWRVTLRAFWHVTRTPILLSIILLASELVSKSPIFFDHTLNSWFS